MTDNTEEPRGFCKEKHNCPQGGFGECDLVKGHSCSHVCSNCGHDWKTKESEPAATVDEKELLKDANKSQFCLQPCPKCEYGTCGRKAGHSGSHMCYMSNCEHRW